MRHFLPLFLFLLIGRLSILAETVEYTTTLNDWYSAVEGSADIYHDHGNIQQSNARYYGDLVVKQGSSIPTVITSKQTQGWTYGASITGFDDIDPLEADYKCTGTNVGISNTNLATQSTSKVEFYGAVDYLHGTSAADRDKTIVIMGASTRSGYRRIVTIDDGDATPEEYYYVAADLTLNVTVDDTDFDIRHSIPLTELVTTIWGAEDHENNSYLRAGYSRADNEWKIFWRIYTQTGGWETSSTTATGKSLSISKSTEVLVAEGNDLYLGSLSYLHCNASNGLTTDPSNQISATNLLTNMVATSTVEVTGEAQK